MEFLAENAVWSAFPANQNSSFKLANGGANDKDVRHGLDG
jgi:hypothetical protein